MTIEVPKNKRGMRNPEHVRSVILRMGKPFVEQLDKLCKVNKRSRRELIEILVSEAADELRANPLARINPL